MKPPTTINRRSLLVAGTVLPSVLALSSCEQIFPKRIVAGSYVKIEMEPVALPPSPNGYIAPKGRFDVKQLVFNKTNRQYHAYRSPQASTAPTSILLLLHGAKRNGASMVDKWSDLANKHNILLVAPDSTGDAWDTQIDTADFMRAVVDHAKQEYGISEVPLYGFGHSAGAILITFLSFQTGNLFSKVAAHAGVLYEGAANLSKKYSAPKPPLALFLGSDDHLFDVESAENSAGKLAAHGQDIYLFILKNHTHWYYDLAPLINGHAWNFLSKAD